MVTPLYSPTSRRSYLKRGSSLFSYVDYSQTPQHYPISTFRLSSKEMAKWLAKKVPKEEEEDKFSEHDNIGDEEEPRHEDVPENKTAVSTGARAMLQFYAKYKTLNTGSQSRPQKSERPTLKYLETVEQLKQVPHPMGLVKWRGYPSELNLQYLPLSAIDPTKWATAMPPHSAKDSRTSVSPA
jgi:hypothetical protein